MKTEQLILSIGAVLIATRVLGWIFQKIGQPRVVGEMTAGIMLGPSLFGRFFPGASAYVFPASSLPALTVLSQLGLLLFMFVVGLEVDLKRVLKQKSAVVLISNVSILLPLGLGIGLAKALYPQFAGDQVAFSSFRSFYGNGNERHRFPGACPNPERTQSAGDQPRQHGDFLCAAIDDISAWLLLAVLTAMVRSGQSWQHFAMTLILLVVFVAVMLFPIRRAAAFLESRYQKQWRGNGAYLFPDPPHARRQLDDREAWECTRSLAHSWLGWSCPTTNA